MKKFKQKNVSSGYDELLINIKLESKFYNNFRNTFKKILNDDKYLKYKDDINNIINDISIIYYDKLNYIIEILSIICKNKIIFSNYDKKVLEKISTLTLCYNKKEDDCLNFCIFDKASNVCNLIIPQYNLITGDENEKIYYNKLADELLRNHNLRNMIMNTNNIINLENVVYHINNDELVLYQSMITNELFSKK